MRDQGLNGLLTSGHVGLLGTDRYIWYNGGDGSFDPGPFDSSLAGRTGIEVPLNPGNNDDDTVANLTAAAITADGAYSASSDPASSQVDVTGTASFAFGSRPWDETQLGLVGMQYSADLVGTAYFDAASFRGCRLDPAQIPAVPFVVTGCRMVVGAVHTAQLTMALYQGGTGPGDFENATLVGVLGTTSGSDTETVLYVSTPTPFEVDPGAGDLWVMWMHDAGGFEQPFPGLGVDASLTSNYISSGGAGVFISAAGPSSSDPADFPATAPAIGGGTFASFCSIGLSYVISDNFPNDMVVVGRFGSRAPDPSVFQNTSGDTLLVGNSYTSPDLLGMEVTGGQSAYDTHVLNSNYRMSILIGGTAVDNFTGCDTFDLGEAGAGTTDTGWVDATPATPVPLPAATQFFVGLHFDASGSILRFVDDSNLTNPLSPPENPAAFLNPNIGGTPGAPESEVDDGTLGGTPTTNVTFDPSQPQVDPIPIPDGTIYQNDNFVGARAFYRIPGAAVI